MQECNQRLGMRVALATALVLIEVPGSAPSLQDTAPLCPATARAVRPTPLLRTHARGNSFAIGLMGYQSQKASALIRLQVTGDTARL